jgi:hypothetical protein
MRAAASGFFPRLLPLRALLGVFAGLFRAIRLAFDRRDAGRVDDAIDPRDDARRVEEDRAPFGEMAGWRWAAGFFLLVAAIDHFEQQAGPVAIGQAAPDCIPMHP